MLSQFNTMNDASYMAATSNNEKAYLEIEDAGLDMGEIENVKQLMKREEKYDFLNPPAGTTEKKDNKHNN